MKITGFVRLGGKLVISAQGGCFITDLEHNTRSVPATHSITAERLINEFGAKPGTKWYVQSGKWTVPDDLPDVRVFATEPGEMKFWVNGTQTQIDYYSTTSFGQYLKGQNLAMISRIDYAPVTKTNQYGFPIFEDPILMLAYTAGAYQPLLEVSYGDGPRHSAVEMFFNGAWKSGSPVDGVCTPLSPSDYLPREISIPGGVVFDETGGRGATGDMSSTVTTRGAAPSGIKTYPGIVSTISGLTHDTPVTDLGYHQGDIIKFGLKWDETNQNYDPAYSLPYNPFEVTIDESMVVRNLFNELDFTWTGLIVQFDYQGKLTFFNTNQNVDTTNAFSFGADSNLDKLFGSNSPAMVPINFWVSVTSTNRFTRDTLLAQFAPKGTFEVALENPTAEPLYVPRTVAYIGDSELAPPGATMVSTAGELIDAINAFDGGTYSHAYLEEGRLVVAITNYIGNNYDAYNGNVRTVLVGRYLNETVHREASELLFGASDFRYGVGYFYNDAPVSAIGLHALAAQFIFSGSMIPALKAYPVVPSASSVTGDRSLMASTDVQTLYPAGYLLVRRDSDGWMYSLSNMEVGGGNTVGDLLNYMNDATMTLRFVDSEGGHQASSGFLRMTSGREAGVGIMWFNPATRDFGVARRLFTTDGVDGSAPTNFAGTL